MKYLMFIRHSEQQQTRPIPQGLQDAMGTFVADRFSDGTLKDTGGLKGTAHGFRVRSRDGALSVTDGPFTEAKEIIGGYALVDVKSDAEARELAQQFMEMHRVHWPEFDCECEVRPLDSQ